MAQAAVPADVTALLEDRRPLAELSNAELTQRIRKARSLIQAGGLDAATRQKLQGLIKTARAERMTRQQQAQQQPAPAEQDSQQAEAQQTETQQSETQQTETQPTETAQAETQPSAGAEVSQDVQIFISESKSLSEMSVPELRARMRKARQLAQTNSGKPAVRRQLRAIVQSVQAELATRSGQASQPAEDGGTAAGTEPETGGTVETVPSAEQPAGEAQDEAQLDNNTANPQDEARAREFLTDSRQAEQLSDAELRDRLNAIRTLMASNRLSPQTERQLRQKLAAERTILRGRISSKQTDKPATGGQTGKPRVVINKDYLINIEIVLSDQRPSRDLADYELRRRIEVYRVAVLDNRYNDAERRRWRRLIDEDRRFLRQRLIEARRARAEELAARRRAGGLDIDIDVVLQPDRPRDIDAAEVEDEDIEDFLVAPPRRKVDRRYTVEELERSPDLRDTISRIEIDTINFGFDEAFVREEEIEDLDRIAEVMERILAAHPREVFVIEGHTDAVGSDDYNLHLSRQRAAAVKEALTTYYVIPEENLRTVGYGERFLKIPTAEAEEENRRVSIGRATALIGELDQ